MPLSEHRGSHRVNRPSHQSVLAYCVRCLERCQEQGPASDIQPIHPVGVLRCRAKQKGACRAPPVQLYMPIHKLTWDKHDPPEGKSVVPSPPPRAHIDHDGPLKGRPWSLATQTELGDSPASMASGSVAAANIARSAASAALV